MKKWVLTILFFAAIPFGAFCKTEYYKMMGRTIAFPYYYEGMHPVLNPGDESYFAVTYHSNRQPLFITHQKNGKLSNSDEGWARMQFIYDEKERIEEVFFLNEKGKPVVNQDLGFAREIREYTSEKEYKSTFYNGKDWKEPDPVFP